jgi:hypothetical protein
MAAPLLAGATDCAAQDSLAPDLSLDYACSGAPPADKTIETFLKARGFAVANPERVRRQFGAGFFPMDIEAIDGRQWTVEFRGFNDNPSPASTPTTNYTVGVVSPPPTVHDTVLEAAVLALVAAQPGCKVTSNRRAENPAAAAPMFDFTIKILRNRMHEAAICDQTEASYDTKACDAVPGVKALKSQHP